MRYLIEGKPDVFEDEYLYRKFGLVVMKFISIANINNVNKFNYISLILFINLV